MDLCCKPDQGNKSKLLNTHTQTHYILLHRYLNTQQKYCSDMQLSVLTLNYLPTHTVTVYLLIMLHSLQEPATRELLSNFLQTDDQPTSGAQEHHKDHVLHFVFYPTMQLINFLSLKQKSNPMWKHSRRMQRLTQLSCKPKHNMQVLWLVWRRTERSFCLPVSSYISTNTSLQRDDRIQVLKFSPSLFPRKH